MHKKPLRATQEERRPKDECKAQSKDHLNFLLLCDSHCIVYHWPDHKVPFDFSTFFNPVCS